MRLPGRCSGCGTRVELGTDRDGGQWAYEPLPWAWCEPNSDTAHTCVGTGVRSTMGRPGVALTTPAMPDTDETGAEMADRT